MIAITHFYDIETYPNLFLAIFKEKETGAYTTFEISDWKDDTEGLVDFVSAFIKDRNLCLAGFNNHEFDDIIIKAVLDGYVEGRSPSAGEIAALAELLIKAHMHTVEGDPLNRLYQQRVFTSVDLAWLDGSGKAATAMKPPGGSRSIWSYRPRRSLKAIAGQHDHPDIQELPFPPETRLTAGQRDQVIAYCLKDVDKTEMVARLPGFASEFTVRDTLNQQYPFLLKRFPIHGAFGTGRPQLAEAIIVHEICAAAGIPTEGFSPKKRGVRTEFALGEVMRDDIGFHDPVNQQHWEAIKQIRRDFAEKGKSKAFDQAMACLPIRFGDNAIVVATGGLHSSQASRAAVAFRAEQPLFYLDASSYYPSLILKNRLIPAGLTPSFLDVFQRIVDLRLDYKDRARAYPQSPAHAAAGYAEEERAAFARIAEALKVVINAVYGKLGEKKSVLYDPMKAKFVTMNGQGALLMLIEALTEAGANCLMANTDGLLLDIEGCGLEAAERVRRHWEEHFQLALDAKEYDGWVSLSINEYFLINNGKVVVRKGRLFANPSKTYPSVVGRAVEQYFLHRFAHHGDPKGERFDLDAFVHAAPFVDYVVCHARPSTEKFDRVAWGNPDSESDAVEVQQFNRFYYASGGKAIYKRLSDEAFRSLREAYLDKAGAGKTATPPSRWQKIANTDGASIVNNLPATAPSDIDYEKYLDLIDEQIWAIESNQAENLPGASQRAKKRKRPSRAQQRIIDDLLKF